MNVGLAMRYKEKRRRKGKKFKSFIFILLFAAVLNFAAVVLNAHSYRAESGIKYYNIRLGDIPKTRSIAIDKFGNVWIGNKYSGTVQEINGQSHRIIRTIFLGKGSKPRALAIDGNGNVWAARG